jgi:hypothetical protein
LPAVALAAPATALRRGACRAAPRSGACLQQLPLVQQLLRRRMLLLHVVLLLRVVLL